MPWQHHLAAIHEALGKIEAGSEEARRARRGSRESDRLWGVVAEHQDEVAHHVHELAEQPDLPEHVRQIVEAGHRAFGERGERRGEIDPEGFAERFRALMQTDPDAGALG